MQVEITLKNYRCFQESNPVKILLSKGAIAFIGVNNSGKSSILRFFYEFRSLFSSLCDVQVLKNMIEGQQLYFTFPKEILDYEEVFCNANTRPIEIGIRFILDENIQEKDNLPIPEKILLTIPRATSFTGQIYLINQLINKEYQLEFNGTRVLSNGNLIADFSYIYEFFTDLSQIVYIGPFRNAISVTPVLEPSYMTLIDRNYFTYFDIKTGRDFIQEWRRLKTGTGTQNKKFALQVTEDIKHIFGFNSLEINSSDDAQSIQMFIDGNPYVLSELGSGLAQFFLVLANVAVKQPSYIFIDEPELNLHPSLQLDFLTTLNSYARKGIIFATHSIGLARASAERIYTVHKGDNGSKVTDYEKNPRLSELLGELSFSTYREFGFDKVLLVEGSTEIKTIQQFLRKYRKDHEILLLPLGGSSLINESVELELKEIKRITERIFALIDSERPESEAELDPQRQGFLNICKQIGIDCHILERRATENYFSDRAVKLIKGPKFRQLEPYEKLKDTSQGWSKAENWRIAREMNIDELEATDLGKFIKRLCN